MVLAMVSVFISPFTSEVVPQAQAAVGDPGVPLPNPPLKGGCGQNVALVVDLSGSMDPGNAASPSETSLYQLKQAATQYVNILEGSNSQIALFTFGSFSPNIDPDSPTGVTRYNDNHPLTSVQTDTGAQQVKDWINNWRGWGWTRWDLGLQEAANSGEHYDYVLFITDGYPTDDHGNTVSDTSVPNKDAVVAAANAVKAEGTRIIVIYAATGTGSVLNAEQRANVEAISGPIHDQSVMENDYYEMDWSAVAQQFQALANMCTLPVNIDATRTIHYVDSDGATVSPDEVQHVRYVKTTDLKTGNVTYDPDLDSLTFASVTSPAKAGYTPDKPVVGSAAVPVTADSPNLEETVTYTLNVFDFDNSSWDVTPTTSAPSGSPYANGNAQTDYWTATLTAKDQYNVAMTDLDTDAINFAVDPMNGVVISSVTNNDNGTYSVKITSTVVSSPVASVTYNNQPVGGGKTISFQAGDFSYTKSTFDVTPQANPADESTWVSVSDGTDYYTGTLTAKDDNGNVKTDLTLTDIVFSAPSKVTITDVVPNPNGTYTVRFSSTVANTAANAAGATAAVTYKGTPVGVAKPIPFRAGDESINPQCSDGREGTNLSVDKNNLPVGELSSATAYVTDKYCNPKKNVPVTFSLDPQGSGIVTVISGTTDADGNAYATVTDTTAETVTLHASIPALMPQGEILPAQPITFIAGTGVAANSTLVVDPASQTVGENVKATVTVRDANNNLVQGQTVALSVDGKATFGQLDADRLLSTTCTTDTKGQCFVYLTDKKAEIVAVSATVNGDPVLGNGDTTKASPQNVEFTPGEASVNPECQPGQTRPNISASPTTVSVSESSTVTAYVTDQYCNAKPNANVTFSLEPGTNGHLSDTTKATNAQGYAVTTLTDTTAETVSVNGAITEGPIPGSPVAVTFIAGAGSAANSTLVLDRGTQTVGQNVRATVTVRDAGQNLIQGQEVLLTLNNNATFGQPLQTRVASKPCTTDVNGECYVDFTDTTAELVEVSATVNGDKVLGNGDDSKASPQTVEFVSDEPSVEPTCEAGKIGTNIAASPDRLIVGSASTVTAYITDKYCNPKKNVDVTFSLEPESNGHLADLTKTTDAQGYARTTVTDTTAETVNVNGNIAEGLIPGSPVPVEFTAGGLDARNSTFDVYPTDPAASLVVADGTQSWTGKLVAKDSEGNLLSDLDTADMHFGVTPSSVTISDIHPDGDGVYTVTYTSTTAGSYVASLTYGDDNEKVGTDKTILFVSGVPDDMNSDVTVSPDRKVAGSWVTITVTAKDANQNPVSGLSSDKVAVTGTSEGLPELTLKDFQEVEPGVYTYSATSRQVGEFEVSAIVVGVPVSKHPHVTFYNGGTCVSNADPVDSNNITRFELVLTDQQADGVAKDSYKAYAYDCNGNAVPGASVVVNDKTTAPLNGVLDPQTQTVQTGPDGTVMIYWTSTKAGTFVAEGTIDGLRPVTGVMNEIRFTNGTADPAKSELVVTPASPIQVGGSYTAAVTVRDASGNLVPEATVSFSLDPSSPAQLSSRQCQTGAEGTCDVSVSSNLVTTVAIHATLPVNGQAVDVTGNGDPAKASPQTVSFTAGPVCVTNPHPVDPANVTRVEVITDGAEANGSAIDEARAYAYDCFGNPVSGASVASTTADSALNIVTPIPATGADGTTLIQYKSQVEGAHQARVTIDSKVPVTATNMDGNVTTDGTIMLHFGSGTASAANSTLTISPTTSQTVDSAFIVTAHVRDANNNMVSGAMVTFPAVDDLGFSATSCVSGADGTCPVTVSSPIADSYRVSAKLGIQDFSNTVDAVFTAGPVCVEGAHPVDKLKNNITRVRVTLDGREADGVAHDIATAFAYDCNGNPVAGASVQSTPGAGETLVVQPNVLPTAADGTTTIWYSSTQAGTHTADVTIAGLVPDGSPVRVSFGSGNGDVDHSSWVVAPEGPLTVGETEASTYTATATVRDSRNNPVEQAVVVFAIDPDGPVFTDQASCITNAQGVCSVKVSSTKSGTYSLTASITAGAIKNHDTNQASASIAWRADAVCSQAEGCEPVNPLPDELHTRVDLTIDGQAADGTAKDVVTVWAFDKWGNAVEGALVQATTSSADLRIQSDIAAIGKDGSSTVWYTSMVAATYRTALTADGVRPVGSPLDVTFVAGPVCVIEVGCVPIGPGTEPSRQTRVSVTVNDQKVNGSDIVTVWAFDKAGNAVEGTDFAIATSDQGLSFAGTGHTAVVTSGANGTATLAATSAVGGHHSATAKVDGIELTQHGSPMDIRFLAAPAITSPKDGDVTNEKPLVITGTGQEPGDTVTVKDGDNDVCHAEVLANGTWSCQASLDDGSHTLVAVETTPDGKDSPESAPVEVEIDTVAPHVPVITGPKDGDTVTDDSVTVTGTGDPDSTITVKDGDKVVCTAEVHENGEWSCEVTLDDGDHTLTAVATDEAGNQSDPSAPVTITVDTGAPDVPVITGPKDGDVTNDKPVVVTGTGEPGTTITVKDGDTDVCTTTVGANNNWTCDATLDDGDHTLTAVATDEAGNESAPSDPVTITVDTDAPDAPVITGPKDGDITKDDQVTVTGTGEPNSTVTVKDGDKVVCEATADKDGNWTCDVTLGDGDHTLTAVATDEAGNESEPSEPVTITVDTKAPDAPVVDPSNGSEVTGTAEPGTTVTVTNEDGTPVKGCEDVKADETTGRFSCIPDTVIPPKSTVTVTAKDPAGNVSEPQKITIGSLGIEIAYPNPGVGDPQVVSGFNFNPAEEVCLTIETVWEGGCQKADANGKVTFAFTVPAIADGSHTVTLTGAASGQVSASFTVAAPIQVKTGGTAMPNDCAVRSLAAGLFLAAAGAWVATRSRKTAAGK